MTVRLRFGSVPVFSVMRSSYWILRLAALPLVFNDMFSFEVVEQISRVTALSWNFCPTHSTEYIFLLLVGRLKSKPIIDVAPVFLTSSSVSLTLSATFIQDDEYDDSLQPAAARGSKFRG